MDGTTKHAPSFTMPFIDIGVRVVAMDSTLTVDQLKDQIFVKKKKQRRKKEICVYQLYGELGSGTVFVFPLLPAAGVDPLWARAPGQLLARFNLGPRPARFGPAPRGQITFQKLPDLRRKVRPPVR